jgi:micrococcal nuclease
METPSAVLRVGQAVQVRLSGVDASEKAQRFSTKARKLTGDLVFQHDVTVLVHPPDRYGRLVREVLLPDGRSLGHELVGVGLAWWYQQYAPHDTLPAQSRGPDCQTWAVG